MKKTLFKLIKPIILIPFFVAGLLGVKYTWNLFILASCLSLVLTLVALVLNILCVYVYSAQGEDIDKKIKEDGTTFDHFKEDYPLPLKIDLLYQIPIIIILAAVGSFWLTIVWVLETALWAINKWLILVQFDYVSEAFNRLSKEDNNAG